MVFVQEGGSAVFSSSSFSSFNTQAQHECKSRMRLSQVHTERTFFDAEEEEEEADDEELDEGTGSETCIDDESKKSKYKK